MDTKGKVKIGIIGSQFQADIHAASLQIMPHEAELVAVASPTPGNAEHFAKRFNIPRAYTDYREMLKDPAIEVISICAPNSLHCQMTKDAAAVGKVTACVVDPETMRPTRIPADLRHLLRTAGPQQL